MTYLIKKLTGIIPILIGVTFITFALLQLAPGDPVTLKLASQGANLSDANILKMRSELGLDQPMIIQYGQWLLKVATGDFGVSFSDQMPVASKLLKALPNTILLTLSAILLTLLVSLPLGLYTGFRQGSLLDRLIMSLTFLGASLPNFVLSLFLIYGFALQLKMLPVLATNQLQGLILPTLSISIGLISRYTRQIRGAVIEELAKDYVRGLRSRGVNPAKILFRNIMPNLLPHLITWVGLSVGTLLGGAAVVETIFVWRGLGKLAVDAIAARDYPVIQGFVVVMAFIYVGVNTFTDLFYKIADPRISFDEGSLETQRGIYDES